MHQALTNPEFLIAAHAIFTAGGAMLCLMVMQVVTKPSGFTTGYTRLHLCQRFSLAALSLALAYDTYVTLSAPVIPVAADVIMHGVLCGTLLCWAYRKNFTQQLVRGRKVGPITVFGNAKYVGKPTKINNVVID